MVKYYTKAEEIPEEYLDHMKQWDLTDEQKVEMLNSLQMIVENIFDMHFGTGAYAGPHHDAAAWRAKQKALQNRTPEQVYDDAYNYWMGKFGKYNIKKMGLEATEAECRKHAEWAVAKDLETKERWEEFKERLNEPTKKSRTRKKMVERAS